MSGSARQFTIDRRRARGAWVAAIFAAGLALGVIWFFQILQADDRGMAWLVAAPVLALLAIICADSVRVARVANSYALEVSSSGVRESPSGAFLPWRDIGAIRLTWGGVAFISRGGRSGPMLREEVGGFVSALNAVLEQVSIPIEHGSSLAALRSLGSIVFETLIFGGMFALSIWLFLTWGAWAGLIPGGGWVLIFASIYRSELRAIEVSSAELSMRARTRTRSFPLSTLSGLRVDSRSAGRGSKYLVACLEAGRETIDIALPGRDAFSVYFWLRAALAERAGK